MIRTRYLQRLDHLVCNEVGAKLAVVPSVTVTCQGKMAAGFEEENMMFTSLGRAKSVRRKDFSGFKSDEGLSSDLILRKRVIDLEAQVRELFETLKVSNHNYEVLRAENIVLRNDCDCLRNQVLKQEQSLIKEMDDKQCMEEGPAEGAGKL